MATTYTITIQHSGVQQTFTVQARAEEKRLYTPLNQLSKWNFWPTRDDPFSTLGFHKGASCGSPAALYPKPAGREKEKEIVMAIRRNSAAH